MLAVIPGQMEKGILNWAPCHAIGMVLLKHIFHHVACVRPQFHDIKPEFPVVGRIEMSMP